MGSPPGAQAPQFRVCTCGDDIPVGQTGGSAVAGAVRQPLGLVGTVARAGFLNRVNNTFNVELPQPCVP
ncbi:MAG: hypothetical protein IID37_07235 [Planctomycetes bacterium]|nr:hypothetical protein [Planctomycetota bacterium]